MPGNDVYNPNFHIMLDLLNLIYKSLTVWKKYYELDGLGSLKWVSMLFYC